MKKIKDCRMLRSIALGLAAATLTGFAFVAPASAQTAEPATPPRQSWTFAGPFGYYDQAQLQRGFKIYKEVCSNCHALSIPFRALEDEDGPGFSIAQVTALAATYKVQDGPDGHGDMFQRPGRPSDMIPPPFPNPEAASAALGQAPPDMSTLAKARTYERGFPLFLLDPFTQYVDEGPDYIDAILHGYTNPKDPHYNKYFPGGHIAMPQPLVAGQVQYTDGTPMTLDQYALDVASFLQWASEPTLVQRKEMGFRVMVFLIVFAGLLYFTKKRIWARAHGESVANA
jgi:ubiquinol-cytochrome c reductase cytochrome c1 subunit